MSIESLINCWSTYDVPRLVKFVTNVVKVENFLSVKDNEIRGEFTP